MRCGLRKWVVLSVFLLLVPALRADELDFDQLEKELSTTGLHGWIHGAAAGYEQYVFTLPGSIGFLNGTQFSVIATTEDLKKQLSELHRHDEVLIKGHFAENPSPQKHIELSEIQIIKKFDPGVSVPPYQHEAKLPEDLLGKSELLGVVHAVPEDGSILVMEYEDAVVPVYTRDNTYTKDLYRGDKIRLQYKVLNKPKHPTHLMLNTSGPKKPIEVIDSIVELHGKHGSVEGALVFFPQSPGINRDIYAIQQVDELGLKRNFTLVNFDDIAIFEAILSKLAAIWKPLEASAVAGRNYFINPKIRVRATGTMNEVSKSQANPQVLLESADDVVLIP